MGRTVERTILLLYVIIHLIGCICSLNCPRFEKHEALRKGLLDKRAICRAAKFGFEDKICLNGLMSEGFYCATGTCNIFGTMCDGHCFTGNDNIDTEHDLNVNCDDKINLEQVKLCDYYRDRLRKQKKHLDAIHDPLKFPILPPRFPGLAAETLYELNVFLSLENYVNIVC